MTIKVRDIDVEKLIGESSKFRVYLGHIRDQQVVVKVAKTFKDNDVLVKDARTFNTLRTFDLHLQDMSERLHQNTVDYNLLFANLVSSFMAESQGDRRINVYTTPGLNFDSAMPLAKLSTQFEIDARTSVWIIGRLFKFYGMFELLKIARNLDACNYPVFSEHDYFIGPEIHRLVYYNFSDEIYDVYATEIVKHIASYMLKWTVFDDTSENQRYQSLLEDFSMHGRETAAKAHEDLYDLIRELWGIHYYPFTYRAHETTSWKIMKED